MRGLLIMLVVRPGRDRFVMRQPMAVEAVGMLRVGAPGRWPRPLRTRQGGLLLAAPPSRGPDRPAGAVSDETEHRESREVDGCREQGEVGSHLGSSPDPGPPAAVTTARATAKVLEHLDAAGAIQWATPAGLL